VAALGLNLTLNLHLEPVAAAAEAHYAAFARALGFSPEPNASSGFNASIPSAASPPFVGSVADELSRSRRFAEAYLALLDGAGTNVWWLDDEPRWVARLLFEHSQVRWRVGAGGGAVGRWAVGGGVVGWWGAGSLI
jgi:hypothetical protein